MPAPGGVVLIFGIGLVVVASFFSKVPNSMHGGRC